MELQQRIAEQLSRARSESNLSVSAVADAIGVVRQTYSKYEQGTVIPPVEQLIKLCKFFDKPMGYFYDDPSNDFRFAMRSDNPEALDSKLRNELTEKLKNIYTIEEAAEAKFPEDLPNSFPLFTAKEADLIRVEDKADEERRRLGIGESNSISDIVSVLESADIRIIPFSKECHPNSNDVISGFSAFSKKYGTAIYVNNHHSISIERQIFSICHEYAHIIFHREDYEGPGKNYKTKGINTSPEEKIANHFAACFLVPEKNLRKQFMMQSGGGWAYEETVLRLKEIFRVSYSCVVGRLYKCKLITKANSNYLWARANSKGWLKHEPKPILTPLAYKGRMTVLARKAWENGSASEAFIGELLDLSRKDLSLILCKWYEEQEDNLDAISKG